MDKPGLYLPFAHDLTVLMREVGGTRSMAWLNPSDVAQFVDPHGMSSSTEVAGEKDTSSSIGTSKGNNIPRSSERSQNKVLIGVGSNALEMHEWPLWALELPPHVNAADLEGSGEFLPWRKALLHLKSETDKTMLITARSLLLHQKTWKFCPRCGSPLESHEGGSSRHCRSPTCSEYMAWYPRVDPVIITLITHEGSCLLARQRTYTPGMYTCVAGFLESGETLEECVQREVYEEVGLHIKSDSVHYVLSQPWPTAVASNLMLGCWASVTNRNFMLDQLELEDAKWFTKEEVSLLLSGQDIPNGSGLDGNKPIKLSVPGLETTANKLLQHWVNHA